MRRLGGLVTSRLSSLGAVEVWTVLEDPPESDAWMPFQLFKTRFSLSNDEVLRATLNCRSAGISHLTVRTGPQEMGTPALGLFRIVEAKRGPFLEFTVVTDFETELHPPQPGCWEAYTVNGLPGLVTPDLFIPIPGRGQAIVAFLPLESDQLDALNGVKELTLRIECPNPPPHGSFMESCLTIDTESGASP